MSFKNIWRILLILLVFIPYNVTAEENRMEVMIDFRVNVAYIDQDFSNNSQCIEQIVDYLNSLKADTTRNITSVEFCGAASPEGPHALNRYLAGARLASLEKLIRSKVYIPDSIIVRNDSYIPGAFLREELAASGLEYKDTVMSIIDQDPVLVKDPWNGKLIDRRIVRLKRLYGNSRIWNELFRLYFSKMRNASAVIITYKDDRRSKDDRRRITTRPETLSDLSIIPVPPRPVEINATPRLHPLTPAKQPFYMAVKSNMLYDAAAVPNIGVEFYLGKNWSIAGNWMHAWWNS